MAEEGKSLSNTSTDIIVSIIALLVVMGVIGTYLGFVFDFFQTFVDWIYSKNWSILFKIAAVVFTVFDAILIWFLIFILRRHAALDKAIRDEETSVTVHTISVEDETNTAWQEIRRLANSPNPSDWNMAIIRADGLLDDVLQHLGYEGETMADRLKIVDPGKLPSLDRVWSAHRLRNTIVHGPMQEHTRETVVHALRSYELALKELGVLKEETKA